MFLNESRAKTAERCLRAYYFYYLYGGNGLRPQRMDDRLLSGILGHAGLAAFYRYGNAALWRTTMYEALLEEVSDFENQDADFKNQWLEELDWLEKVIGRYASYAATVDNFSVHGVEQSGHVELGEACWQCGAPHKDDTEINVISCWACDAERHQFVYRLDLLVGLQGLEGRQVIDHKFTSASMDPWYLDSWKTSYQLWGYCYGSQKQSGIKTGSYAVNLLRKVKAAAEEPDLTKCCPACKNGKIKVLSCQECNQTGRVPRLAKPADIPFVRIDCSFGPREAAMFVDARVRLCNKLVEHTRRFAEGDWTAFPHNPSSRGCPEMCHQMPKVDLSKVYIDESKWVPKGPDYVTVKRMALEEAREA